jgi:hypothetical protein
LKVDLALLGGKIVTMGERGMAEAVAVKGDRILMAGSSAQVRDLVGQETKLLELNGKTVVPGFIESHCHVSRAGTTLVFEVNVRDAKSIDDVIGMLRDKGRQLPEGRWILGRQYDDRRLKEKRHPTRWDLDKASTEHFIFLQRLDGHMAVANNKALELAGVTKATVDPKGGKIDRVANTGEPNGLLRELAQDTVMKFIPPYTIDEIKRGILSACQRLAGWGITSFTDTIVDHDTLVAYQDLEREGKMPLRAGIVIPWFPVLGRPGYAKELKTLGLRTGFGNEWLRVVGSKFMADGSMSGWTAALYEPYSNEPNNCGIMTISKEELREGVFEAHQAGLRPCIHAIGDRTIDVVLDVIEEALAKYPVTDHRIRIEHCSLPTPEAVTRIKRLGVLPSSAIGFLYELGSAHLLGLGPERIRRYFPHRTYFDQNIVSVGHSDWMVTAADVAQQIYGAVTRKSYLGETIGVEQAIPVMEALRLYTTNAAYASFEEKIKGSIEQGKLADMVVLDRDILSVHPEEIKNVRVETTIVGGTVVYQRGNQAN